MQCILREYYSVKPLSLPSLPKKKLSNHSFSELIMAKNTGYMDTE